MKVIIAGSRHFTDAAEVMVAYHASGFKAIEIVSGGARGVDEIGERLALELRIPVRVFHADWTKFGKAAGPIRNRQMAEYADALILVWDGQSKGSSNMLFEAKQKGLKIFEKLNARKSGEER